MEKPRILIADDEPKMRRILQIVLGKKGYQIDLAEDGNAAWQLFRSKTYDLIITDLKMPSMDGLQLLNKISVEKPNVPVIVITAYGSVNTAVKALKAGAFDYITKPFENEEIKIVVKKALAYSRLETENKHLRLALGMEFNFDRFIGKSDQIQAIRELAKQVTPTHSTILIQGESGTGKELLARLIHYNSPRCAHPFIAFNCGALPDNLLESELFGYEKGAFTGAQKTKLGRFELADKGTLFLDEVGDMTKEAQVKMLRVLEEKTIERLGGTESIQVNCRIIAATNRDLKQMVNDDSFRSDLFYRLNIFPIGIPPLREHKEDIPMIVSSVLSKLNNEIGKQVKGVSAEAMRLLCSQNWQGNVRELQNCLERAMILCQSHEIDSSNLFFDQEQIDSPLANFRFTFPPEGISLEDIEKSLIQKALSITSNNQSQAAALLKITRNTLRYRMEKYSLFNANTS
ncbi:MAG: sigma-54-dependent Fis family transcriptional regulator [Deltaproteobacteria bacterium]|jgi:DNA-binding NtrC family response regulator|nr:sigma-54-dependent Fis family transcriptional regulator [Deltaproteobacteria bacterium]